MERPAGVANEVPGTQIRPTNETNGRPRGFAGKHPITQFLFLTFLISWGCWLSVSFVGDTGSYIEIAGSVHGISSKVALTLFGNYVPGIVALIVLFLSGGRKDVYAFLLRFKFWRIGARLYLFAFLCPIAILLLAALANLFAGGSDPPLPSFRVWIELFLINLPFAPLWEEIGWRGFLLPRLQEFQSGFRASIILGIVWGVWHVPLLWHAVPQGIAPVRAFFVFFVTVTGLSVLLAWLYNRTSGALLPVIIFHGIFNATSPYLIESTVPQDGLKPLIWAALFVWSAALAVRFMAGSDLAYKRKQLAGSHHLARG